MKEMWKSCRHLGKLLALIFILACCLSLATSMAFAADEAVDDPGTEDTSDPGMTDDTGVTAGTDDGDDDAVESHFANPAQAAKAANLAEASAMSVEEMEQLEQEALADLEAAKEALENEEISEEEFAAIEAAIDQKLSSVSGVSESEIADMRDSGMGWGEIAHEIGVHPSVLGLGHKKSYTEREMVEATARNTKTGLAKGHGLGLDTDRSGFGKASAQGLGKSMGANKSSAAGLSGGRGQAGPGKGKGQGKGNNGNNGGGKGGGKGGGNGGGKK